jgi:predicted HTH transcriptional regulator
MEQLGTGTQRLIDACKELGARKPVWRVEQGTVTLKLFRTARTASLVGRQARFMEGLEPGREFRLREYAREAGVSERQARRDLAELEAIGILERRGKGPATAYARRPPRRG